jgi:hypothetical protein
VLQTFLHVLDFIVSFFRNSRHFLSFLMFNFSQLFLFGALVLDFLLLVLVCDFVQSLVDELVNSREASLELA